MKENKKMSTKELLEPYKIKNIKIAKESKIHIPGLVEYIEKQYGHLEITNKGVALVKKK